MKPLTSFHALRRIASFTILTALVITSTGTNWSSSAGDEEPWRPVEASDLALKAAIVEPNADAEAIFWDIRIDDGGDDDLVLSHYVRIKIFTERGRDDHSKMDIPYIDGTRIKEVAARTIKPDGSIIEVAKADIIEKTVVKVSGLRLRTKTFAFPGIEQGAIIEYKWKEVISRRSAQSMPLQFQREIPVQAVTYRIKPANKASFDVRPFNMPRFYFRPEKDGFQVTTVRNMPAFRTEPLMPPEESVRSWAVVKYYFSFFDVGYTILAQSYYFDAEQLMKSDDVIKQKSAEIVADAKTPEEKLHKIFAFCRANIKNTDNKNSGFTEAQLEKLKENKKTSDTLKRGVGTAVDINLLFAALATAAGFESRIVLLPDRGRRLFDPDERVPGALRPACIGVKSGETWRLFDPGLRYIADGMLRWQEEGVDGLIADARPVWIKTPLSPPEKSKEKRVATLRLDENGTLEGEISIEYTGHLGVELKLRNEDDSPVQREMNLTDAVKARLSSAELTNIIIENATDSEKPFIYKYHVRVPGYAQRTGKRLFFQPGYFTKGIDPLFSAGTRRFPIYFHFPWSEEDKITIDLPRGYALENAEQPAAIKAGKITRHEVKIGATNDQTTLVYNRSFFFGANDAVLFPVASYDQIKRVFDEAHRADNHLITLRQIEKGN